MDSVYLCLTCLKMSALQGDCHEQPMIRCGDFGVKTDQTLDAPGPSTHWLVQAVAELNAERLEGGAD